MSNTSTQPPGADQLEAIMRDLVICYEQMLTFAKHRRDAIRAADTDRLAACVRQENTLVQQVAEIEKRRISVVRALAESLGSDQREQTTVSWIASRLGDAGGSLRILADHLRATIAKVTEINNVTKQAAETLAKHMRGIIDATARKRSFVTTYKSTGGMAAPIGAGTGLNAVA